MQFVSFRRGFSIFLLLVFAPTAFWAQATAVDQISGTVRDSTEAVVPGAQVKAVQVETGFVRMATTDSDGTYVLTSLPIGPYEIEVTAAGFKAYKQRGVVLQVNTNPTLNPVLEVGQVTEQIEVQANAQMAGDANDRHLAGHRPATSGRFASQWPSGSRLVLLRVRRSPLHERFGQHKELPFIHHDRHRWRASEWNLLSDGRRRLQRCIRYDQPADAFP